MEAERSGWRFTSVPGYFRQDNESTDDISFNYIDSNFSVGRP